jgi:hypothetical protein
MNIPMPSKPLCLISCLLLSAATAAQTVPKSSHVWVINEENHGIEDVVGNWQMPYYNQLIAQYGLATQFYADQHSSLPALMWYVAGAAVEPNNDTVSCEHTEDNIVRALLEKDYTWKSYQENLPYAGFQGLYSPDNLYYRRHNPLIDFSDVCPGTSQDTNSVPLTQLATDLADGTMVNYAWITPNVNDDAHNGTLQQADQWLEANVPAILARPEFKAGGDGILLIVWDESDLTNDNSCSATVSQGCGGHLANLVIGPQVKPGYQSTITYHSENALATICAALGISTCPGAAATAAPMADFFSPGPTNSVSITSPENQATVLGVVKLTANASESKAVTQMQVWDNGVKLGYYNASQVNASYDLAAGSHTTTVLDLNSANQIIHQSSVTYNVQAIVPGVQIVAPTANETSPSLVHVVAQGNESDAVGQMQVWDNGVKLGYYASANVNQYFNLAPGSHTITVLDQDIDGNVLHRSSVNYRVSSAPEGVEIATPAPAQSFSTPVIQLVAQANESETVSQVQVWDNGVKLGWFPGPFVNQLFSLAPGTHTVTVLDLGSSNQVLHQSSVSYAVH